MKVTIRRELRLHIGLWYILINKEVDSSFFYRDDADKRVNEIKSEYEALGYTVVLPEKTKFTF